MPRSTVGFALRQLCLLGFVVIEPQGGRRHNTFTLATRWEDISNVEAKRLRAQAGAPQRTATPVTVPLAMAADG